MDAIVSNRMVNAGLEIDRPGEYWLAHRLPCAVLQQTWQGKDGKMSHVLQVRRERKQRAIGQIIGYWYH